MPGKLNANENDRSASSMHVSTRILVVDDDPIVAESLAELLNTQGYETATANDGQEALDVLADAQQGGASAGGVGGSGGAGGARSRKPFGILIVDHHMPRCDGMELLKRVKKEFPDVVPIMVTGFGKLQSAVESVRHGATDYLTKPIVDEELRLAVERAVNHHHLLAENVNLKNQLTERFGMGNLVGGDYRMQKVYDLIESVADSKTTVLITGESGTGKSMVARAIHTLSTRNASPFVTFAVGSIPETLLESELFGHVKGAFTGADHDKPGKCLAADNGTLFIDEINSATSTLQLKLLRVLQEKAFEPIGSTETINVDIRFVLATNSSLEDMVREGQFREDLYYRINVVSIHLPALRERPGDIPLLADHFLRKYCKEMERERVFGDEAVEALVSYHWPGNVRELENAVERAVLLSKELRIEPEHLPDTVTGDHAPLRKLSGMADAAPEGSVVVPALADGWRPTPLTEALEEPEKQIIKAALDANDWNRQETAAQLEINRTTLYKKIKAFGLDRPDGV